MVVHRDLLTQWAHDVVTMSIFGYRVATSHNVISSLTGRRFVDVVTTSVKDVV